MIISFFMFLLGLLTLGLTLIPFSSVFSINYKPNQEMLDSVYINRGWLRSQGILLLLVLILFAVADIVPVFWGWLAGLTLLAGLVFYLRFYDPRILPPG